MNERSSALLIDANSLIHRAWHAMPPMMTPDGRQVNAVYGFTASLLRVLSDLKPTHVAVCWDTPEPTFRHTAEPTYKAHRVEQPQEFYDQIPLAKEIVDGLGIRNIELPGFEADDILGTMAAKMAAKNIDTMILTSDRDAWQLIGPHVSVVAFKKGVSETVRYDAKALFDATGLKPEQIPDFKAMRGDPSDNLKGVQGIGEKTATTLLQSYGNLNGVFGAAHDPKSKMTDAVRAKLLAGEKDGRATLSLVYVVTTAPVIANEKDIVRLPVKTEELKRFMTGLGFKSLVTRIFGSQEKEQIDSPAAADIKSDVSGNNRKTEQKTKVVDAKKFLSSIQSGDELVVHAITVTQGSLFQDTPLFALRSAKSSCIISRSDIEALETKKLLSQMLADMSVKKIGHNLKRTWHACKNLGFDFVGIDLDTQIAAYLLSSGEGRYELEALSAAMLERTLPDGDERPLVEASAIWDLAVEYRKQLHTERLDIVMSRFDLPLVPVLGDMEAFGIMIDKAYFKKLAEVLRADKARLEEEMIAMAGEPFNPGSPAQLSHILFDVLQIPSKGLKRGKTAISTAASEMEKLEGVHPIIEKISEYREVAKLLSTYVEPLPDLADADGRVHTTFNLTVASTGRLSSSNPNVQNIPVRTELGRKIRKGFVAPKGKVLVSCDYSQIELRIIAALAKDERMLDAFNRNADIHTETAAAIWHIKPEEVTKEQRRAAKAVNFGIIYGQGPQGLARSAGVPFAEAKMFIEEYFSVYGGIAEYLEQTKALAHAQGYVETLFGRRRPIADINSPLPMLRAAAERMAINMPVQGTAADIMKLGLIEVAHKLSEISSGSRVLLQVHDELLLEVPENDVARVAASVINLMSHVEKIGCPIVVDAKMGLNWDKMSPIV